MATVKKTSPHVEMRKPTHHFAKLMRDHEWSQKLIRLITKLCSNISIGKLKQILSRNTPDSIKINEIMRIAPAKAGDESPRANGRAAQIRAMYGGKVERYVDFGCGDRTITEAVGAAYGLKRDAIIGVDLFDSGRQGSLFERDLDLVAPGVDLITCFVSLHHTNVEEQIAKISRLVTDGVVIIREHDAPSGDEMFYHYLQAVHIVAAVWDTAGDLNEILDSANYHSREQWMLYFERAGFSHAKMLSWSPNNNPQRLFYAAFSKKPLENAHSE